MGGIELSTQAVPRALPVLITPPPAPVSGQNDTQAVGRSAAPAPTPAPAEAPQTHMVVDHGSIQATLDYDRDFNQIIITLRQQDTGETLQQFPAEQVLKLLASFLEQQGGQHLDTKG